MRPNTYSKLISNIRVDGNDCWIWLGPITQDGYAKSSKWNKTIIVHRYVAFTKDSVDPDKDDSIIRYLYETSPSIACHHCDVRNCINPICIFLGTPQDNTLDALDKGRLDIRRGELSNWAKLTEDEVYMIREEYRLLGGSQTKLGAKYGISQTEVSRIVLNKRWRPEL